jgi:hypothetical protein
MGPQEAVSSQATTRGLEERLAAGELATASPARYVEIGTDILETVVGGFLARSGSSFDRHELRAEAWVRLHKLSRQEAGRPRTRHILALEIKKAITKFARKERAHSERCVGLFQDDIDGTRDEGTEGESTIPAVVTFSQHHCAPYSIKDRLTDPEGRIFSGRKTWTFSHLDSKCHARKSEGVELICAELEGIIRSLRIIPFRTAGTAASDKHACYRVA